MIATEGRHRRAPRRGRTYVAGVLVDQAVNSASNVAATVVVAAAVPGRVFAVFATGQLVLALGQTVMIAAAGDRLLQSAAEGRPARHAAGLRFYRRAVAVGAVLFAVAAVEGSVAAYVAAGAVATLTCSLDYVRVSLIASGQVRRAVVTDSLYALLQVGGLVGWSSAGAPGGAVGGWLVWGGSALLVLAPYAAGVLRAFPKQAPERVRDAVSLRYGVEMAAVNGSAQVAQLVASTTIGLALNAMVRGSQIGFGVVVVALVAARTLLIPLFTRPDARRLFALALVGVTALCVVTGAATWVASSQPELRFLVAGQRLDLGFVALTTAVYVAFGGQQVVFYLLRARHDDGAVGLSRVVAVVGFAATAVWAGSTRSIDAFLVGSMLTWLGAAATMVWRRRRHRPQASATDLAEFTTAAANTPVAA